MRGLLLLYWKTILCNLTYIFGLIKYVINQKDENDDNEKKNNTWINTTVLHEITQLIECFGIVNINNEIKIKFIKNTNLHLELNILKPKIIKWILLIN